MALLDTLDLPGLKRSELSDETFNALRTLIYNEAGIHFPDNKRYLLESRVGRRLSALSLATFEDYHRLLLNGGRRTELPLFINSVTINETYFFRQPEQIDLLKNDLIPGLIAAKGPGPQRIRIWSAASSTGDEAYTVGIMIREQLQPKHPSVQFEIVGTDINSEVVRTAQAGIYSQYAVRNIPPAYMQKYFRREGNQYHLSPDIKQMATFRQMNLMDRSALSLLQPFDIILCANVLIYFDAPAKQRVVHALYNSLRPGGYLLISFSETLYGVSQSFNLVRFGKNVAYQR